MECPKCKKDNLKHRHNEAHGIHGTHMSGSERYECECGFYVGNAKDGEKYELKFIIDKKEKNEKEKTVS